MYKNYKLMLTENSFFSISYWKRIFWSGEVVVVVAGGVGSEVVVDGVLLVVVLMDGWGVGVGVVLVVSGLMDTVEVGVRRFFRGSLKSSCDEMEDICGTQLGMLEDVLV